MNRKELEIKLNDLGIPNDSYNLYIDKIGEQFILLQNRKGWEVYYSERGNKNDLKTFITEEDACNYFYSWMIQQKEFHNSHNHPWARG